MNGRRVSKYRARGGKFASRGLDEDMLAAAQMYDLGLLKEFYEEKLCKCLDISNCVDMLVLGDFLTRGCHPEERCDEDDRDRDRDRDRASVVKSAD